MRLTTKDDQQFILQMFWHYANAIINCSPLMAQRDSRRRKRKKMSGEVSRRGRRKTLLECRRCQAHPVGECQAKLCLIKMLPLLLKELGCRASIREWRDGIHFPITLFFSSFCNFPNYSLTCQVEIEDFQPFGQPGLPIHPLIISPLHQSLFIFLTKLNFHS